MKNFSSVWIACGFIALIAALILQTFWNRDMQSRVNTLEKQSLWLSRQAEAAHSKLIEMYLKQSPSP